MTLQAALLIGWAEFHAWNDRGTDEVNGTILLAGIAVAVLAVIKAWVSEE